VHVHVLVLERSGREAALGHRPHGVLGETSGRERGGAEEAREV